MGFEIQFERGRAWGRRPRALGGQPADQPSPAATRTRLVTPERPAPLGGEEQLIDPSGGAERAGKAGRAEHPATVLLEELPETLSPGPLRPRRPVGRSGTVRRRQAVGCRLISEAAKASAGPDQQLQGRADLRKHVVDPPTRHARSLRQAFRAQRRGAERGRDQRGIGAAADRMQVGVGGEDRAPGSLDHPLRCRNNLGDLRAEQVRGDEQVGGFEVGALSSSPAWLTSVPLGERPSEGRLCSGGG